MNAGRLLAHYDRVADSPDAVSRLRRFVLDLAVRGRLVEQYPADEPASELLKSIAKVKEQLGVKHQVAPLAAEEVPFHLPAGWHWSRIGELCTKTGSGSTPRGGKNAYSQIGIPFFRSQNVYNDGLRLDDVAYIGSDIHARMAGTTVQARDLLLNITGGSMGRCCRIPDEFSEGNISQHVAIIRPTISKMTDYLHKLVLSPYFQAFIFDQQTGAGRGGLPKHKMDRIAVAVPPICEQRRIVAKVNELMTLCDQLEETRTKREETRDRLAKASHARLSAPDTDTEAFRANARFAINVLPQLSARADQVKHLRQTILNLAVRGRLVEQDPGDEPASDLLQRIVAEKARLVKLGEIKPRKLKSRPREHPLEFETPIGWQLTDLGSVATKITDGAHKTPTYVSAGVPFVSVKDFSAGRLNFGNTRFIPLEEHELLYQRCDPRRGDILLGRIGTLGKAVIVDTDLEFSLFVSVGLIRFDHTNMDPVFFRTVLNSPFVEAEFSRIKIGGGTHTNKLNLGDLHTVAIPLPPLAEQHRIVTKVGQLMALCDRLENSLGIADSGRQRLLESLLRHVHLTAEPGIQSAERNPAISE